MSWLPTLITKTPEEGYELALTLSRKAVQMAQPDDVASARMRPEYTHNPDSLMMASEVVAINFNTVAQANNYWRSLTQS